MGPGVRRDDGEWERFVTQPRLIEHDDVIAMGDRNQVLCSRSADFNEAIRAFLDKRNPVYIRR
jgi:hypothetical protein